MTPKGKKKNKNESKQTSTVKLLLSQLEKIPEIQIENITLRSI